MSLINLYVFFSIPKKSVNYLFNFKALENDLISFPSWFNNLAALCLFIYSFFAMTSDLVGGRGLKLVSFIGVMVLLIYGKQLFKSRIFWLLLGAVCVPLISWSFSHISHPIWAEASPKIHRLTNWFLFIPIAVILGGRTKNVMFIFLLALLGALSASFVSGFGWQEWVSGFKGTRIDFGLHNAQHAGLLYGTCLLGLVSFAGRFIRSKSSWGLLRFVMWFAAFLLCSFAVVFSQSRGIWLGLIGASALYIPFVLFYSQLRKRNSKRFWLILVLCVLTLLSLAWSLDSINSIVTNRLAAESGNIERLLEGDTSDLVSTSIGVRLISWSTAWSWIKEHPLVGWGGQGRRLVMEHSIIPGGFGHLHNSYLDVLVNYGFFGILLFFFLIWWLLKKSLQVWKEGGVPNDLLLFFWLFIIFWLIVNLFESYMFFSSGIYIFNIVCGGILTHIWQHDCHANKVEM